MNFDIAGDSRRGCRKVNQDRFGHTERGSALLMVVADGLGAYADSEVAAEMLKTTSLQALDGLRGGDILQPTLFLNYCILQTHKRLHLLAREHDLPSPPRTTGALCLIQNGYAYWAHVGDSRLYHIRGKKIINHTVDHASRNATEQKRGSLLQCIGSNSRPVVEHSKEFPLEKGDIILACTDGVWDAIDPGKLAACCSAFTVRMAVKKLLNRAEAARPHTADNMTALFLTWNANVTRVLGAQNEGRAFDDQDWLWEQLIRGNTDYRTLERSNPALKPRPRFKLPRPAIKEDVDDSEISDLERLLDDRRT